MSKLNIDWIARSKNINLDVRNFISGRWGTESSAEVCKYAPRDGSLLCRFGISASSDIENAVSSARAAYEDGRWSASTIQARKEMLYRLASLVERNREELALLDSLDVGKPISHAFDFDVPEAVATLRFSAEAADKFYGKVYGADPTSLSYELRRPLGVVAGITGWNFPLLQAAQKIGPVLATGNSLVLKPSELTSLSTARIASLAMEAGLPGGVLNVVHGDASVGSALAQHPNVDLVTFTGSSETGKRILIASGQSNMKRLVLECGGKAPNIVFDDFPDLEAVAEAVLTSALWNQGEVCAASSRLLVQATIKTELLKAIVDKVSSWTPGDPLRSETRYGALVSEAHQRKVVGYIEGGRKEGAVVAYEANPPPPHAGGFYLSPVIFDKVMPEHRIAREEIFGPVLSVIGFQDEEDAIRIANNTIYGLTAVIWTQDLRRAHRAAHGIKAGQIVINATAKRFGGPADSVLNVGGHKQSGIGAEGGVEGLEAYTSKTAVQLYV